MINSVSNFKQNSAKISLMNSIKATPIAFEGNPLSLIKKEGKLADEFLKGANKIEKRLPISKKALIAADHNSGPPILTSDGMPISDPDMPGTVLHYLAKGDPGYIEHAPDFIENAIVVIKETGKAIFDALFG